MKRLTRILVFLAIAALLPFSAFAQAAKTPVIGIVQLVEHVALDSAYHGFVKALEDKGYKDGENIKIDYRNAQANQDILNSIADHFVGDKVDLILAIATPAAQAMAAKTDTIPILGTAITDYVVAKLAKSNEAPGFNVSGTTDMNPVAGQMDLLLKMVPTAKTVGLLYTSSEDNSILQIRIAKEALDKLGLKYEEVTVNNSNDVQQAAQSLVDKCDALYVPTDNVIASSIPIVSEVFSAAKKPIICGESGMLKGGATATVGINYYNLGYQTGLMAVEALNGADVAKMPIEAQKDFEFAVNKQNCDAIGLAIPEDLVQFIVKEQ